MIREFGPVLLIPAAWIMTFLTVIHPGLDTYWIEHMHYFMIVFLTVFLLTSWKEMETTVLEIWRKVILLGLVATAAGAVSFHTPTLPDVLASISLFYWLAAPGIGAYYSNKKMSQYAKTYRFIGYAGITSLLLYLQGYIIQEDVFKILAIFVAAVSQTYSILIAAKLDKNL